MPFAALHQLCLPMLGETRRAAGATGAGVAGRVRAGVREPAGSVRGRSRGARPARRGRPRSVRWCVSSTMPNGSTSASRQVLGFVGRRLLAEAVLLLLAVRETGDERLLPGPAEPDARGTHRRATPVRCWRPPIPGHLDDRVRDRIVAETRGNPLGLLELPRGMSPAELAGGFVVPHTATVPGRIEEHYLRRVTRTPGADAATDAARGGRPHGRCDAPVAAPRETLGLGRNAAARPSRNSCSRSAPGSRFRHPLVRSAAYAAGTPEDRRAVHLALAAATDRRGGARTSGVAPGRGGRRARRGRRRPTRADGARGAGRAGLAAAAAFLQRARR